MISAILFDLDGTLLDRESSLVVYLRQQVRRHPRLLGAIPFHTYLEQFLKLDRHGHRDKTELFQDIATAFNLPSESGGHLLRDFYAYFPDVGVPFPRMHQTLATLKKQGLKLAIVTNGRADSQDPKIDGLGIRPYFDTVLVSETEGLRKPETAIFQRALARLGVPPEQSVFVGDHPTADIAGATAAGLHTVWIRDPYWGEEARSTATISKLADLPTALDRLPNGR